MASCLQKFPAGNESRAEGENDEMGIPNYHERSRLNNSCISNLGQLQTKKSHFLRNYLFIEFLHLNSQNPIEQFFTQKIHWSCPNKESFAGIADFPKQCPARGEPFFNIHFLKLCMSYDDIILSWLQSFIPLLFVFNKDIDFALGMVRIQRDCQILGCLYYFHTKLRLQITSGGNSYHIGISKLICETNRWTGCCVMSFLPKGCSEHNYVTSRRYPSTLTI